MTLLKKLVFALSAFGVIICVIALFPAVRSFIISLVEKFVLHRTLNNPNIWLKLLFRLSVRGIMFFGFLSVVCLFVDYQKYTKLIGRELSSIDYKNFLVPFLFMSGIYVIGITSIIRANFLYIDDLGRTINGYRGWIGFSRYINDVLAAFIHADIRITDISPLTQLFAALIIAAASAVLSFVVSEGKITKTMLVASLPLGLSPYFLECISYKFDSPYMALSIFISVIPFLFMSNRSVYFLFSFVGMLIMAMTYQASSGIYILVVILLSFQNWNEKKRTPGEILRFIIISGLAYGLAMTVFRLFLMIPMPVDIGDYVSTSSYPLKQLVPGIFHNFVMYLKLVNSDFGKIWKILLLMSTVCFVVKSALCSKRNRVVSAFAAVLILILLCAASFGVYLALIKPLYSPRAMYGFGVFIALINVYIVMGNKKVLIVPVLALCWCFFVFSFSYGNALADQKRYNDFKTEMLLHDLALLFPNHTAEALPIKLLGRNSDANDNTFTREALVPSIQNIAVSNPVINRLVPVNLGAEWVWLNIYLTSYYHFNLRQDESITDEGLETILDSNYHMIKSDGQRVLVYLK